MVASHKLEEQAGVAAKAAAISAVVILHTLALFPEDTFLSGSWSGVFLIASQLLRFCVPLFLALSGYGLGKKYFHAPLSPGTFLRTRVLKLLPLYLLWSVVIFSSLALVESWRPVLNVSWWQHIFLGSIDYHLYFVLLIFQCYAVFAVLPLIGKRGVVVVSGIAAVLQLLWFTALHQVALGELSQFPARLLPLELLPDRFLEDQIQYRLLINWIFYFLLGVTISQFSLLPFRKSAAAAIGLLIALLISGVWVVRDALFLIEHIGVTTYALGFVRPAVFLYAITIIWGVLLYAPCLVGFIRSTFLPQWTNSVRRLIKIIGTHSYLIFLSHTLGLRIIAEFLHFHSQGLRMSTVLVSGMLLAIGLVVSRFGLR